MLFLQRRPMFSSLLYGDVRATLVSDVLTTSACHWEGGLIGGRKYCACYLNMEFLPYILHKSPYSVRMQENTDQKKTLYLNPFTQYKTESL